MVVEFFPSASTCMRTVCRPAVTGNVSARLSFAVELCEEFARALATLAKLIVIAQIAVHPYVNLAAVEWILSHNLQRRRL